MKLLPVLILLTAAISAQAADKCPSRQAAQDYIKQSEARWAEQSVTNDMSVIREIIADDYVGVSSASRVVTKEMMLKDVSDDFVSNKIGYVDIHFFSDSLAVAQGKENWELKGGRLGSYIWTDTWLCRKGRWQIIASQDTPLPR
jgi:hypothetical protein